MKRITTGGISLIWMVTSALIIALAAGQVSAGERVQLEGVIKGAGCTHFQVECKTDDNHMALEADFVLVMPDGEYYFMPNVYRSVKARHAYKNVRVHGERRRQEIWVHKLVDLDPNPKKRARSKSTWDWWANDDFWMSK
jgi:hypothetical protein